MTFFNNRRQHAFNAALVVLYVTAAVLLVDTIYNRWIARPVGRNS